MSSKARITQTRKADKNNVVHTIIGGGDGHCEQVCPECPWRKDRTGSFPAEAFRHSANTAEDMSSHTFACHMAGTENPKVCAGFLLRGADDNMAARLKRSRGKFLPVRETVPLHGSYKAMAVANGCRKNDPALRGCMPEAREAFFQRMP